MPSNLPPGVTTNMIPGCRPEDEEWDRLHEKIDDLCAEHGISAAALETILLKFVVRESEQPTSACSDGRCPTCRQRNSRVREHKMDDGSVIVWHCNISGCSNHADHPNTEISGGTPSAGLDG